MKYLILAYGSEADWNALSRDQQTVLLAQDDVLRGRGDLVAAVKPNVTTLKAWDGVASTTAGPFADSRVPLAGFGIIEANDINEVMRMVANTPCARAGGAVEIRLIGEINDVMWCTPRVR